MIDKWLQKLGRRTLDVYIYHYFFIMSIHLSITGDLIMKTGNFFLELLIVIFLAIIVSICSTLVGDVVRRSIILSNIVYGNCFNKILKDK